MADLYFEGDPETESTRRQMERLLRGERRRRWPWLLGAIAGGTAFAFWRSRRRAPKGTPAAMPRVDRRTPAARV